MVSFNLTKFIKFYKFSSFQMFSFKVLYNMNSDWFGEGQELHVTEQVLKITDSIDLIAKLLKTIVKYEIMILFFIYGLYPIFFFFFTTTGH
jgi:hypothetical protein